MQVQPRVTVSKLALVLARVREHTIARVRVRCPHSTPLHLQGGPLSHSAKATEVGPLRNPKGGEMGMSVCMRDV